MYAFNNLHDVSWGTKGSDKADVLPAVSSSKPKGDAPAVVEDVAPVQEDIDAAFQETVTRAVSKLAKTTSVEKPTLDVRLYRFILLCQQTLINLSPSG